MGNIALHCWDWDDIKLESFINIRYMLSWSCLVWSYTMPTLASCCVPTTQSMARHTRSLTSSATSPSRPVSGARRLRDCWSLSTFPTTPTWPPSRGTTTPTPTTERWPPGRWEASSSNSKHNITMWTKCHWIINCLIYGEWSECFYFVWTRDNER